jgi:hypothetical protein
MMVNALQAHTVRLLRHLWPTKEIQNGLHHTCRQERQQLRAKLLAPKDSERAFKKLHWALGKAGGLSRVLPNHIPRELFSRPFAVLAHCNKRRRDEIEPEEVAAAVQLVPSSHGTAVRAPEPELRAAPLPPISLGDGTNAGGDAGTCSAHVPPGAPAAPVVEEVIALSAAPPACNPSGMPPGNAQPAVGPASRAVVAALVEAQLRLPAETSQCVAADSLPPDHSSSPAANDELVDAPEPTFADENQVPTQPVALQANQEERVGIRGRSRRQKAGTDYAAMARGHG